MVNYKFKQYVQLGIVQNGVQLSTLDLCYLCKKKYNSESDNADTIHDSIISHLASEHGWT